MPGILSPSINDVAAVAGWPGVRSLLRVGWTSFSGDRVSVYHRLADEGGPTIEVTTYVDGHWIDRSTQSFMLEQMRVHASPPREERAAVPVDGAACQWAVLSSRTAWVAVSQGHDPVITLVGREFPLAAIALERVPVSELAGYDRLVPTGSA